jgi:hypothetical protein
VLGALYPEPGRGALFIELPTRSLLGNWLPVYEILGNLKADDLPLRVYRSRAMMAVMVAS